jgi:hypothetical protein
MTVVPEPTSPPRESVLDYAGPQLGRRHRFKHVAAIVFAVFAFLLGALAALNAMHFYGRSLSEPTTREKRLFRQDAAQFVACSLVLIVPGIWYGRIGVRGEPTTAAEPGR